MSWLGDLRRRRARLHRTNDESLPPPKARCRTCFGEGRIKRDEPIVVGGLHTTFRNCPACEGTGRRAGY